jgi:sugar lactone lactonase YvrE
MKKLLILLAALAVGGSLSFAGTFVSGDVFASIGNGLVEVHAPNGALITTLDTGLGGYTTGSTTDSHGNFYVTAFSASKVSQFDSSGNLINANWAGASVNESIVFNKAGQALVSSVGGNGITTFDSAGNFVANDAAGRTDWIDLASDQKTVFITEEGGDIARWDLSTHSALADFANGVGSGSLYAIRIATNGDVFVASSDGNVYRLNSAGAIIQTYNTGLGNVFALNLDPNGTSFWTGVTGGQAIREINIATGAIEQSWNTSQFGQGLYGLSVYGEIQTGGGGVGGNVPEPATYAMLGLGLGALALVRKRRA